MDVTIYLKEVGINVQSRRNQSELRQEMLNDTYAPLSSPCLTLLVILLEKLANFKNFKIMSRNHTNIQEPGDLDL
jgi:hypothetical protein